MFEGDVMSTCCCGNLRRELVMGSIGKKWLDNVNNILSLYGI